MDIKSDWKKRAKVIEKEIGRLKYEVENLKYHTMIFVSKHNIVEREIVYTIYVTILNVEFET